MLAGILGVTGAGARTASRQGADQKAYALAETGINNAVSQLAACGGPPCDTGRSRSPAPVAGGTVTWGVDYGAGDQIWTIKAIGSVTNPTGPARRMSRARSMRR